MRLSLGAWWPEGRSSSSVSQFCHHAPEALARWQCDEKTVTGVIWVLDYFCSSAFAAFEVDVLQRGGQTLRCAQLSARLSAELCSPDLWRLLYRTEMHWVNTLLCFLQRKSPTPVAPWHICFKLLWTVFACKRCSICAYFSPDSGEMTFTGESILWIKDSYFTWKQQFEVKNIGGLLWCFYHRRLILMAPIHCSGSIGEQMIFKKI